MSDEANGGGWEVTAEDDGGEEEGGAEEDRHQRTHWRVIEATGTRRTYTLLLSALLPLLTFALFTLTSATEEGGALPRPTRLRGPPFANGGFGCVFAASAPSRRRAVPSSSSSCC